jgi:toxin ParE1/3/4
VGRQVVWTEPAWDDLAAAADYVARDSVNYAAALVQEVKKAAASLTEFADRGQVVPEFEDETIRELLVRPYRLVYMVLDDEVLILALVHGARRIWRSGER